MGTEHLRFCASQWQLIILIISYPINKQVDLPLRTELGWMELSKWGCALTVLNV